MKQDTRRFILQQMENHKTMTVATVRPDGWPQATTVAYANDGLNLYFACDPSSQKVQNVARCNKVSAAIDRDDEDWSKLKGLSLAATAEIVTDRQEADHALTLLGRKFPALSGPGKPDLLDVAIVKLVPKIVSTIDYEKGFGHSELVEI